MTQAIIAASTHVEFNCQTEMCSIDLISIFNKRFDTNVLSITNKQQL